MYEKIPTAGISREEWLKLRKTGIGGSDAGAVCRLDPYRSITGVFKDKTCGSTETKDNESMRQGRDLEDYVAARFSEATGLKTRRSNFMYRSLEYPYMVADVDRLVTGMDAGLECKTASAYSADKWKNGNIPLHYLVQCYHYMAVTGKKVWYIAAVILGKDFVYHRLEWDDALISQLRETEGRFWHENIIKGIMPEPDGSKACDEVLAQYFHTAKKGSFIELSGFDEKLDRRAEITGQIAALQQEQAKIEQELKKYMGENETASSGRYKVSWSNVETVRLETKRIRMEQPQIYEDYSKVSVSRRLQIKAA
ncbi:MAG: endonuclease [Lachnospiraceae bacterium]|nr:endonuclease [Lachnospiraceae bacterium]